MADEYLHSQTQITDPTDLTFYAIKPDGLGGFNDFKINHSDIILGDVTKLGTTVANQVALWGVDKNIKGDNGLTYDGNLNIIGNIVLSGLVDGINIGHDVPLNTAKETNATHTGDVTGSGVLTISDNVVSLNKLTATGTPSASTFLRGDNTWATIETSGGGGTWGSIIGTLSDQTDLQTALDGKASTSHTHTASQVTDFDTEVANNSSVAANTAKVSSQWASVTGGINYSGGNVGIGTTNPGEKLEVNGNILASSTRNALGLRLWVKSDGSSYTTVLSFFGGITKTLLASIRSYQTANAASGDLRFYTAISGSIAEQMRIDKAGKVGIGTTAPSEKLHVSGNIKATGEITGYSSSDIRLKENINTMSQGIDIIKKLRPVVFNWNKKAKKLSSSKNNKKQYGLIAQEVEKVLPELVHPIWDKYKAIDYEQIISINSKAIQELNKKIELLEQRLNGITDN